MTYKFIKNPAPGTNLYFQVDTSGLPMDKLRCFWPFRGGGGGGQQVELMGNAPLSYARGCTGTKMFWNPSNPSGGQLGSCDFSNSVRSDRNGWATNNKDGYEAVTQEIFATDTTPWAFTGWVRLTDAAWTPGSGGFQAAQNQQQFVALYDYTQHGLTLGCASDGTFFCTAWQTLTNPHVNVQANTTDTFSDNTWAFFACGMDGTNVWAVINDGTPTTAACTAGPPTGLVIPAYFGRGWVQDSAADSYCMDGNLADVAYWYNQGSFTSEQLADLYNNGNGNTLLRG